MAKITTKADLVLGTNYKFHLVDFQGTDIQIDQTNTQILSTTTDFTASSETAGIVKRPVEVGDVLTVSNTGDAANEGIELTVTVVAANAITYTVASGAPTDEAAGADINIKAFRKTFQFLEAGALSFVDGVAGLTWVSEVVDQWATGDLDIYNKVFTSIEPRAKSMACLNGWEPHDTDTLLAIRDMAMEIRDTATSTARRVYALLSGPAYHEPTDQAVIWPATDAEMDPPTPAVTTGYVNQLVLIQDTDNAIDDRGNWTVRCSEPGKTLVFEVVNVQYAEIISLTQSNAIDPKLADPGTGTLFVADATVSAGGDYANILLNQDVDSQYDGDVNGSLFSFLGFVDGDTKTNEQVHRKLHWLGQQPGNINNDGTGPQIRGDKTPPLSEFSGDLFTIYDYYLLNFNAAQRNFLRLVDDTDNTRAWPEVYILGVPADAIAVGGTFSVMHADTFGNSSPTYLQDEGSVAQQDIAITSNTDITIAFSTYAVDGHTPGTPIDLVLSWNRPGFIEPDHSFFTMTAANRSQQIQAQADPSYSAA